MFIPYASIGCGALDFNVERVKAYLSIANEITYLSPAGALLSLATVNPTNSLQLMVDRTLTAGGAGTVFSIGATFYAAVLNHGTYGKCVFVTAGATSQYLALSNATYTALTNGTRFRMRLDYTKDIGTGNSVVDVYVVANVTDPPTTGLQDQAWGTATRLTYGSVEAITSSGVYVATADSLGKLYRVSAYTNAALTFDADFAVEFDTADWGAYSVNATLVDGPGYGDFPLGSFGCDCPPLLWNPNPTPTAVTYIAPALDPAPWYDTDIPASARFYGYIVENVSGLTDSTVKREITTKLSGTGGGIFGPYRMHQREMEFTLLLFAADEESMNYGFRYLKDALGYWSCSTCETCDLEFVNSCQALTLADSIPTNLADGRWIVKDVGLMEGPFWADDPMPNSACYLRRATFKMGAENPWFCACPSTLVDGVWLNPAVPGEDFLYPDGYELDRTYTVSEPLAIGETAINVSIWAGSSEDVGEVTISLYPDPFGYIVGTNTPPASWVLPDPCSQIIVSSVPAGYTFEVDSGDEAYTLTSASGERFDATPYLFVEPGTFPEFMSVRCGQYAIVVNGTVPYIPSGDGCAVTIETQHREI